MIIERICVGDFYFIEEIDVYATRKSVFSVVIPKVITLDGGTKQGVYQVAVKGDLSGNQELSVTPEDSVVLKEQNAGVDAKTDVTGSITQTKTVWNQAEMDINEFKDTGVTKGTINADSITAGSWAGTFDFNIELENNSVEFFDYNYILDKINGTILLTKYVGTKTKVYVPNIFTIGGVSYKTIIANNGSWYSYTTFGGNKTLKEVKFQDGVKFNNNDMSFAFYQCSALEKVINLPDSSNNLYYAFAACTSLVNPPKLPSATGNMDGAFHKTGLTKMPELPKSVWNMFHTFSYCPNLVELTEIPANVKVVNSMFRESPKIHGTITLKGAITDYNEYTFYSPNYKDTYSLTVNYSSANTSIVNYLISCSSNPNVKKGVCID